MKRRRYVVCGVSGRAIGMWICYTKMDWPRIVNYSSQRQTSYKPISEATIM